MIFKVIFACLVVICAALALPQLNSTAANDGRKGGGWNLQQIQQNPLNSNWTFVNPREGFINRTRGQMNDGRCTKEVPTASLVDHRGYVPPGNGSHPSLSIITICCEGYTQNPHNLRKCDPVCEKECINGLCVAPNTCSCYPDYILNPQGKCVPTCPIGCDNGSGCDGNKCICKPGYELDRSEKFCVPKCSKGCLNGICVGPEECLCNEGYQFHEQTCKPICRNGCENGDCVGADVCSCKAGYSKNHLGVCEPICSRGCQSGTCIAPEQCSCAPGWVFDSTLSKCEAHCESPCLNGRCAGPNKCECHRGYVLDAINPFMCVANCPNGCPNGVCSGPGFCICNVGFVKDRSVKGSQACVPRS